MNKQNILPIFSLRGEDPRSLGFHCAKSAGTITVEVTGDGNSTLYRVKAREGQFNIDSDDYPAPLEFEVRGEWEFEELAEAMAMTAGLEVVDLAAQPDFMSPEDIRRTFLDLLDQAEAPAEVVGDELARLLVGHAVAHGLDVRALAKRMVELEGKVMETPLVALADAAPAGDA